MYAIVKVNRDKQAIELCFASQEDAERFVAFVELYHDEIFNNGQGTYAFVKKKEPELLPDNIIRAEYECTFNEKMLKRMIAEITRNRLNDTDCEVQAELKIGTSEEALTFSLTGLPDKRRPVVGECATLPMSKYNGFMMVGIVLEDRGEEFVLKMIYDHRTKKAVRGEKRTVSAKHLMLCWAGRFIID